MSYRPWLSKVSSSDPRNPLTPSYLIDKLVAGNGIGLAVSNPGGGEVITITATAASKFYEPLIYGSSDSPEFVWDDNGDIIMAEVSI